MILLAGCGTSKQTNVETNSIVNTGQGNEQSLITAKATYVGLIDTHSIEVIIDDKPIALQINQEQMKILESLKTNEKLSITYFYNEETTQNILEKVEIIQ
jgi:RecB family endonuclease NucS